MDVDPRPDIDTMDIDWTIVPWVVKLVAVALFLFVVLFWLSVFLGA